MTQVISTQNFEKLSKLIDDQMNENEKEIKNLPNRFNKVPFWFFRLRIFFSGNHKIASILLDKGSWGKTEKWLKRKSRLKVRKNKEIEIQYCHKYFCEDILQCFSIASISKHMEGQKASVKMRNC